MVIGRPNVFEETRAQVAQLVEQWTENPRVGGSNPPLGTTYLVPYDSLTLLSPASLGFSLLKISAAGR